MPGLDELSDDEIKAMYGGMYGDRGDHKIIQEEHPELKGRFLAKNLARDRNEQLQFLQGKNPSLEFDIDNDQIITKKPSEKDWRVVDPEGFWSDMVGDTTDLAFDAAEALGVGAATAAGGLGSLWSGGLPGAAAAGGVASTGIGAIKDFLARQTGVRKEEFNAGDYAMDRGIDATLGAVSPLLFGSGATAGQVAKKVGTELGEAGTKKALAALANQQRGVSRLLPEFGEFMTGASATTLRNAPAYMKRLVELEGDGALVKMAKETADSIPEAFQKHGDELTAKFTQALEDTADLSFPTNEYINQIDNQIKVVRDGKTDDLLSPATARIISELEAIKKDVFTTVKGEPIEQMAPRELMATKQLLLDISKGRKKPSGLPVTEGRDIMDQKAMRAATAAGKAIDKDVDLALKQSKDPDLLTKYKEFKDMQRLIGPKFKDEESTFKTLTSLSGANKRQLLQKVEKIDEVLGTDIGDKVNLLEQYRVFFDPSFTAVSAKGSTSTSVTKRGLVIGAGLGGYAGQELGGPEGKFYGAGAGGAAAAALSSPAALKALIRSKLGVKGLANAFGQGAKDVAEGIAPQATQSMLNKAAKHPNLMGLPRAALPRSAWMSITE